ncbi:MAG: serine hydrolase [Chloroflexi bacterium]|nr:serine hydrolase [Chloroflexota bacterium]
MLVQVGRVVGVFVAMVALLLGTALASPRAEVKRASPDPAVGQGRERGAQVAPASPELHTSTATARDAPVMPLLSADQDQVSIDAVPGAPAGQDLQTEIEGYLDGRAGLYGVAIQDLDTGRTVLINADREFLSASTYKVLVMYRVYEQLETGRLSPDDVLSITERDAVEGDPDGGLMPGTAVTVADALELMITVSSNSAAYALARQVGGWGSVDAAAAELGMSGTGFQDGYFRTTPSDMVRFFRALAQGQLVSADASRQMIRLLSRQQVNDRIPALLPGVATVAHKPGELPGVRNDVGIVAGPGGRYVVGVFSRGAHEAEAIRVIAWIARRAYDRYAR